MVREPGRRFEIKSNWLNCIYEKEKYYRWVRSVQWVRLRFLYYGSFANTCIPFHLSTCQCMSEPEKLYSSWAILYSKCRRHIQMSRHRKLTATKIPPKKETNHTHTRPRQNRVNCAITAFDESIAIKSSYYVRLLLFHLYAIMGINLWFFFFFLAITNDPIRSARNLLTMKIENMNRNNEFNSIESLELWIPWKLFAFTNCNLVN